MKKTFIWTHAATKIAHAEMIRLRQSHPSMQRLHHAIALIGSTLQDYYWMQDNDPDRRLDQVLKCLIELTGPKSNTPN